MDTRTDNWFAPPEQLHPETERCYDCGWDIDIKEFVAWMDADACQWCFDVMVKSYTNGVQNDG